MKRKDDKHWEDGNYDPKTLASSRFTVTRSSDEDFKKYWEQLQKHDFFRDQKGRFKAKIVLDTNNVTEFQANKLKNLCERLKRECQDQATNWIEFTIQRGGCNWTIENRTASDKLLSNGIDVWRERTIPAEAVPDLSKIIPDLEQRLTSIQSYIEKLDPFRKKFCDTYYGEDELDRKGVKDLETWQRHIDETSHEKRFRVRVEFEGGDVWEDEFTDQKNADEALANQFKNGKTRALNSSISVVRRSFKIENHPYFNPAIYAMNGILNALSELSATSCSSDFEKGLEMGLDIGEAFSRLKGVQSTPHVFRAAEMNSGGNRKPKKKAVLSRSNLISYLKGWIADRGIENKKSDLSRWFVQAIKMMDNSPFQVSETGFIQHEEDSNGYAESHIQKNLIPTLIKQIKTEQKTKNSGNRDSLKGSDREA